MSIYKSGDKVAVLLRNSEGDDQTFLKKLYETLKVLENLADNGDDSHFDLNALLDERISFIMEKLNGSRPPRLSKPIETEIIEIYNNLSMMRNIAPLSASKKEGLTLSEEQTKLQYDALLESTSTVQKFNQGKIQFMGLSEGECYGFVRNMAKPDSIYKTGKSIVFSRAVYDAQKNQGDRKKDNEEITRTRLTNNIFCPLLEEQAKKLYEIASAQDNVGKDLSITLTRSLGAHATYLRYQNNGEVWYMDPNHGAFIFKSKEQFIAAYRTIYMHKSQTPRKVDPYKFYQVELLQKQKENEQGDIQTFKGKWRSFLNGPKYGDASVDWGGFVSITAFTFLGMVAGGSVGGLIGTALIPIPIIGTAIGVLVGGAIGTGLGVFMATPGMDGINRGLLGAINYYRNGLHKFGESIKDALGYKRENDILPALIVVKKTTEANTTDARREEITASGTSVSAPEKSINFEPLIQKLAEQMRSPDSLLNSERGLKYAAERGIIDILEKAGIKPLEPSVRIIVSKTLEKAKNISLSQPVLQQAPEVPIALDASDAPDNQSSLKP